MSHLANFHFSPVWNLNCTPSRADPENVELLLDSGGQDMWIVMYIAMMASFSAMGVSFVPAESQERTPDKDM
jgi:hypothetical protein